MVTAHWGLAQLHTPHFLVVVPDSQVCDGEVGASVGRGWDRNPGHADPDRARQAAGQLGLYLAERAEELELVTLA